MMQLDPSTSSISITSNHHRSPMGSDLFKAAEDGDMELFNKYQGDLDSLVDISLNTALHIYSRTGGCQVAKIGKRFLCFIKRRFEREFSINFVEKLVDKCPSLLLQPNVNGEIPLHVAARHGHSNIIKFLIERAKVMQHEDLEKSMMKQMLNMRDNDGNTAMHKAVESGDLDVVQLLVKEVDPDFSFSANKSGETPIYIAAKTSRNHLVAEILDNCKSMDYGGPDGRTALHAAVMARDEKSVWKLIYTNKHLTKKTDDNGRTPLHYSAHYGFFEIVKMLLESDASAAYITDNERGMTALHLAAWTGDVIMMESIISHCPGCCEIVDKRGWNFLHFAVLTLDQKELERFLMSDENKINNLPIRNLVDQKDVNGNTPFHVMILWGANVYSYKYRHVRRFFRRHVSEGLTYASTSSETKKEQVRKMLIDIAHDEEVAGLFSDHFREIVKKKDQREEEEKKKHILEDQSKEKRRESHLVVATLVATVTFAAAFTVPGGYKSDGQGSATLIRDSAFKTFVITNTLAFVASLLAIYFHFISVMFYGYFRKYVIPNLIELADCLTVFAMAAMMVAFSTGTYAVLQSSLGFAITALLLGLVYFPSGEALYIFNVKRSWSRWEADD